MNTKIQQKSYHHGSLKDEIIRNAGKIIADKGVVDFSIRDISKLCNVSPSAIYKHFGSRNDIAVTLALEGINILKSKFDEVAKSSTPNLLSYGKAYVQFASNYEGYFRAMYFRQLYEMNEYSEVESISQQLNAHILDCLDNGMSVANKHYHIERMLVCVHGIAFLALDGCVEFDEQKLDKLLRDNLGDLAM